MIGFKRARAYKSVHNAKLRFSLTVKVSEALIQAQLWKCRVQIPQVGAGTSRRRVLVIVKEWCDGTNVRMRCSAEGAGRAAN
jgi:hypothetical protein